MNGITIDYDGVRSYRGVQQAVARTNDLLRDPAFYEEIATQPRFALSSSPSDTIADLMRKARIIMRVNLYYAISPLYNIDGYDDTENPFIAHMNIWRIDRSVASLCNSLVHACVHAVNAQANRFYFNQYYFGHGPATGTVREKTAPYAIGAIAQRLVSGEETIILPLDHDPHIAFAHSSQDVFTSLVANL